jgi:O-antigen ligase
MGGFRRLMPALYPPFRTSPDFELPHAHNQFLQAALDVGIPGLIAFLALWIVAAVLLVQAYRAAADRRFRVLAAGLGCGLAAHFVFGLTDAITLGTKAGVLFWLILGLVAALHRVTAAPPSARPA